MAKIQIYARVRPTVNSRRQYEGLETLSTKQLQIKIGETEDIAQRSFSKAPGFKHLFHFNHVFKEETTQEEIFSTVAEHMVDSFLEGYNGTIFAYGQTSSGKTYTIEGSGRKFSERGLIPRVLSHIYNALEKRTEEDISVCVSYMEIYQDTGFDLLNPGMRPGALMVTLPKVQIAEGANGEVVIRNLSTHLAASEEVAQSLLFQGSTCRRVAETSMNQCSSRSHSIFSIMLTARAPGSEIITRSKLNLVDLAGSERVAKTGADGRILQEAKHINLSLHHLEHVIVALQQQARRSGAPRSPLTSRGGPGTPDKHHSARPSNSPISHSRSAMSTRKNTRGLSGNSQHGSPRPATRSGGYIPYRNCMLTMVLRDSLGGNCLTAMIATISAEEVNIWESISTCRFAQRVACIANRARRNEELDDKAVIKRLKQRIAALEDEVSRLSQGIATTNPQALGGGSLGVQQLKVPDDTALTDTERQFCHKVLYDFFHGKIENPVGAGIDTVSKFQECLRVLRDIVLHALSISNSSTSASPGRKSNPVEELSNKVKASIRDHNPRLLSRPNITASTQISENVHGGSSRAKQSPENVTSDRKHKKLQGMTPTSTPILKDGSPSISPPTKTASTPISESTLGSSSAKQSPENAPQASHRKHKKLQTTTPTSNSRLSSGFGSLQDEDGALCESGYHQDFHKQNVSHKQRLPHKGGYENTGDRLHYTSQPPSVLSPPNRIQQPDQREPIPANKPSPKVLSSPPQAVEHFATSPREWSSPSQKTFSQQTSRHHIPTSPVSPMVSPRQYQALQQQAHLQKKLTDEVNLMNLRVQEEELRGHLSQVGEQLAAQHLRVLKTQPGHATPEQICAERIAEQQLRIKQTKLHQKLLDIQYQVKTLEQQQQQSGGAQELENLALLSSTTQMPNEAAKHEMKQAKVQEQIEKLRVSQMEKQLELKEAATKRKLIALKQQLQNSRIASPPSEMTAPQSVFNKPPATAPVVTPAKTAHNYIPKSESDRLSISVDGKWHTLSLRGKDESSHPQTSIQQPPRNETLYQSGKTHPQSHVATQLTARYMHSTTENKSSLLNHYRPSSKPQTQSTDTCSQMHHPQNHKTVVNNQSITTNGDTIHAEPSTHVCPNSVNSESRARLTLPEEIKETEYMTALQRQRARVCRIRRCIVAATVIQRAWRVYKHNKT